MKQQQHDINLRRTRKNPKNIIKVRAEKTLNSAGLWTVKQHPLFAFLGPLYKGDSDWNYNPGQKSLEQYSNIHIFLSFVGSLLKQCILFEIFLQFSLSPPYTKLKVRKNFGDMRPTLFVGWGERGWTCVNWKMPQKDKFPKTFVHDCSLLGGEEE